MSDQTQPIPAIPGGTATPDDANQFFAQFLANLQTIQEGIAKNASKLQKEFVEKSNQTLKAHQEQFANLVVHNQTKALFDGMKPHIPLPEKFDGSRDKAILFISQMETVFHFNPSFFSDDNNKIRIILLNTKDNASSFARNLLAKPTSKEMTDYTAFKKHFFLYFSDPNAEANAAQRIERLHQGNWSVSRYATEFRAVASLLSDWGDAALIHHFRKNLNPQLQSSIGQRQDVPKILDKFIEMVIGVDTQAETSLNYQKSYSSMPNSQHFNPQGKKKRRSSNATSPAVAQIPFLPQPVQPAFPNDPMQVDGRRRGPLTQQEKEYRRSHNLCTYCGSSQHKFPCPLLAAKNRSSKAVSFAPAASSSSDQASKNGQKRQ